MKRMGLFVVLVVCIVPLAWAQQPMSKETAPASPQLLNFLISGRGTTNTIPQFTSPFTIGNSPMVVFQNNVGIGLGNPWSPLTIVDSRETDRSGNGPAAIYTVSSCPVDNFCGAVRGDANGYGIGLIGVSYEAKSGGAGGVIGITFGASGFSYGVRGDASGTTGNAVGVLGRAFSPDGVAGQFVNEATGNILLGQAGPEGSETNVFRVDGTGKAFANGGYQTGGADFAESFEIRGNRKLYEPGDLLIIDPTGERRLVKAQQPYSTLVAGIYSTKPGVFASAHKMDDPSIAKEVPLAVVGVVPCKVTTENGPINVGDLLVSSSTPGHAMKGTNRDRMLGAVVGKALEPLREGAGVVQVLVTLQ